jgi:hypothetical protein
MLLVNSTGTVIDDTVLRAQNPYSVIPINSVLTNEILADFGYTILQLVPPPAPTPFTFAVEGPPVQVNDVWTQTWTVNEVPLATAQATQSGILNSACAQAIVSGFTSSALGATYTYPSGLIDQQNLAASVLSSVMPNLAADWTTPFWCEDSNGNWAWISHTVAQIQQVGMDGKIAVLNYQNQNAQLQAQVAAATTVDAVAAIVWTNPA